ncbi:MAG: S1 RNA-binding domain-containing protein [Dehalococcoidia bacterium]
MATLLEAESLEYKSLRRGDILEGVVVGSDRDGMVVDVGTKSEGIVPPSEMHSLGPNIEEWPKSGDHILVYVMQPETPEGQVLLSLDRARGEKGWRVLQQRFDEGESFEVTVNGHNKGGLLVNVEGVHGFIPFSQSVSAQSPAEGEETDAPAEAVVGRTLLVKVIEINRARNRVILSERAAMQDWRALQKDRLLDELQEGEVRKGRISSIRSFGVFVDLGGADGLAHLSELSWERDRTPEELYRVGQEVDVYVMKVDQEAKKIALSIRRAQPERWEEIVDKYSVGQIVTGTITKLVTFGAFARIEGPVEGLVHVSELVNRRIAHPREVVKEGDQVPLKIVRIERDRQRLGLSLRQARDEAEDMGFVFDKDGRVTGLPGGVAQKGATKVAAEGEEAAAEEIVEAEAEALVAEEIVEAEAEALVAEEIVEAEAEAPVAEEIVEAEAEALVAEEIAIIEEAVELEAEAVEVMAAIEEEEAEEAVEALTADVAEAVEEPAVEDVAAEEAAAELPPAVEKPKAGAAKGRKAKPPVNVEAVAEMEPAEAVEAATVETAEAVEEPTVEDVAIQTAEEKADAESEGQSDAEPPVSSEEGSAKEDAQG